MRNYFTLQEAGKRLPVPRHVSTMCRWSVRGFYFPALDKIIRLQHVHVGRRLFTTEEWLEGFIDETSAAQEAERQCRVTKPGIKVDRIVELYKADAILRRAGI